MGPPRQLAANRRNSNLPFLSTLLYRQYAIFWTSSDSPGYLGSAKQHIDWDKVAFWYTSSFHLATIIANSELGCRTCRRKHRKCDEKRPACGACISRNLDCKYQVTLKWACHESISSFGTNEATRQKLGRTSRQTPNASSPKGPLSSAASISTDEPWPWSYP